MSRCQTALLLWVALAFYGSVGCDPFHVKFADVEPAEMYRARDVEPPPTSVDSLVVMTYNIKFGGGRIDFFFDCYGDRVLMSHAEVVENLEALAAKIRQVDPDIVLLQEVDVNSKRSAYVDQAQWLLDHTSLNYGAYAATWRVDFVPSDGLGAMDSGNAILSRWPIHDAKRLALPLIEEQDWLTRYFYIRSNILRARIAVPGQDQLYVVLEHADAYGKDGTKKKHIDRFIGEMDALAAQGALVVSGGDLNTLPPGSDQQQGFDDSVCELAEYLADDYRPEVDYLVALYDRYEAAVPLDDYHLDNARYYSHTVDGRGYWNRKLDYLFTNATWRVGSGMVHQDGGTGGMNTMELSDHAPLTAVLELP